MFFYLTANKNRVHKLCRFGEGVGSFKVTIEGDETPFVKDDQAVAWLVSFLNCSKHVCSVQKIFCCLGQIALKTVKLFVDM